MTFTLSGVSFSYGRRQVLDDITVEFESGTTWLLGPNGAGKTTLLNLIAGVSETDKGRMTFAGTEIASSRSRRKLRAKLAWLPQQTSVVPGLSALEHVAYAAWLKGLSRRSALVAAEVSLDRVGLLSRAKEHASRLSGGQQRRLGIAGALAHDAQVILMDEPTVGLDPVQRKRFWEAIADLPQSTITVISSHDTNDNAEVFDHATVLEHGRIRFEGSYDKLRALGRQAGLAQNEVDSAYMHLVRDDE